MPPPIRVFELLLKTNDVEANTAVPRVGDASSVEGAGYGLGALGESRRWTSSMPIRMPARMPAAIAAISLDLAFQGFRGT
jgi:hypothetical protein